MSKQLSNIAERFWDRAMKESPLWATILGNCRFEPKVEVVSANH